MSVVSAIWGTSHRGMNTASSVDLAPLISETQSFVEPQDVFFHLPRQDANRANRKTIVDA